MRPQNPADVKKSVMAVVTASVLLASTCFGSLFLKTNALAEGADASIKCTSAVKIDEAGNVLSANVTVTNNTLKAIDVAEVVAPAELSDWQTTFETTSVAASGSATGTWDGKTVPAEILQQVKDNRSATLTFQTVVAYDEEEATVIFDANAPSGTTATVDGTSATKDVTVATGTTLTVDLIPADASVTCVDATWEFAGWAETPALLPSDALKNADLAAKAVALTGQKTYYAIWKDTATSEFWLSSTNENGTQVSDFTSDANYRSGREILNDVDILKEGSANASYATVLERWNGYYTSDVKLYANYDGGASEQDYDGNTSALNGLVEFHILEVSGEGGHLNTSGVANSSDGSVVTFMATHVLPTAYAMNVTDTNVGGWSATALRGMLQSGGDIYKKFPTSLTSAIAKVPKLNNIGGGAAQGAAGTTTNDAFWLPSYSELYATGDYFSQAPTGEGTVYQWCVDKSINGSFPNAVLTYKTRAGATPGSCGSSSCSWWERSPYVGSSYTFMGVYSGDPSSDNFPHYRYGVISCFAF